MAAARTVAASWLAAPAASPPAASPAAAGPVRRICGIRTGRWHGCVMKTGSYQMSIGRLGRLAYNPSGLVIAPTANKAAAVRAMAASSAGSPSMLTAGSGEPGAPSVTGPRPSSPTTLASVLSWPVMTSSAAPSAAAAIAGRRVLPEAEPSAASVAALGPAAGVFPPSPLSLAGGGAGLSVTSAALPPAGAAGLPVLAARRASNSSAHSSSAILSDSAT